jgi:hypothetical protein
MFGGYKLWMARKVCHNGPTRVAWRAIISDREGHPKFITTKHNRIIVISAIYAMIKHKNTQSGVAEVNASIYFANRTNRTSME